MASDTALVASPAVVRALLAGEQIVDLRPAAPGAAADLPTGRVWLVPTAAPAALKPAYRMARELSLPEVAPPIGQVRIEGWAEVEAVATVRLDGEVASAFDGRTVLDVAALASSLGGGPVTVVVLRARRLHEPFLVSEDLAGLPVDPGGVGADLALSDIAFEARRQGVSDAVPGGLS